MEKRCCGSLGKRCSGSLKNKEGDSLEKRCCSSLEKRCCSSLEKRCCGSMKNICGPYLIDILCPLQLENQENPEFKTELWPNHQGLTGEHYPTKPVSKTPCWSSSTVLTKPIWESVCHVIFSVRQVYAVWPWSTQFWRISLYSIWLMTKSLVK